MTAVKLAGRILFLSADPLVVEAQLAGAELDLSAAGTLRDDISTDEITPVSACIYFDHRLASYPYTGFKAGKRRPIGVDAVRHGGFAVTVAGARYGKGSSREHSPAAEMAAGIRLVIARSFERIYRQNADNLGLYTSTDFGLIDRIRRGEPIDLEKLIGAREAISGAILRSGGLLRYGARLRSAAASATAAPAPHPQTFFQKILARHVVRMPDGDALLRPGTGAFVRADWRFIHEYFTGMCSELMHSAFGRPAPLWQRDTIVAFEDHLSYSHRSPLHAEARLKAGVKMLSDAHRELVRLYGLRSHGYLPDGEGSEGICHAVMAERYALPGQLVAGTDSHTPHISALGCLAFGVGTTDMANAMVTGMVRITIPEALRVELNGSLPRGVTAKDIVLHLLAMPSIKAGAAVGKVIEFTGSAISGLTTDERATLTNMTAELGGFSGIVAPDTETVRFLRERRGLDFALEPWMCSDADATYADTLRVDCATLAPMVAAPGDPGNGIALPGLKPRPRIDIAYGGSCTAGKREDFDRYHEVLAWAAARGLRVPSHVKLFLQFGTTAVRDYCVQRGYLDAFSQVGAELLQPACGACANCGPGSSTSSGQITVSAINRNFPGRSGPGNVWLVSPPTVAASAIAGELLSFDELRRRCESPRRGKMSDV
jgi:3-isopropylmalate/(R)-2-methylmalate dehydratase large subunit